LTSKFSRKLDVLGFSAQFAQFNLRLLGQVF